MLHCDIRNTQIKFVIHNKTTNFVGARLTEVLMYNWMLQQKENFNCTLESKVKVNYNKENVLWT
jgi:hypothetical protein